jgi:cellulose synthase (UDP-forming)
VNFAGRSFDLEAYELRIMAWWPRRYPSVDVFLPICGEPIEVLRNTWEGVAEMAHAYPGRLIAYVLDDGPSDEAAELARMMC